MATVSFGDKDYFVFSSPLWIHKEEIPVIPEEEAEEEETESQKEEGPDKVTSECLEGQKPLLHGGLWSCGWLCTLGSLDYCHMALIGQQETAEMSQAQRPKVSPGSYPSGSSRDDPTLPHSAAAGSGIPWLVGTPVPLWTHTPTSLIQAKIEAGCVCVWGGQI